MNNKDNDRKEPREKYRGPLLKKHENLKELTLLSFNPPTYP